MKNKALLIFFATVITTHIFSTYTDFPWWIFTIISFIISFFLADRIWRDGFFANFLGIFFLWILLSWWIDVQNNSILSTKISELFSLNSIPLLFFISALIGGLCAGLAGALGAYLKQIIMKGKKR